MSRLGVVAAVPCRSRLQATLDVCQPSTKPPQHSALFMRVQARWAQRAAAKAAAANVAAKRPEVPRVPRVARYQRHASTLESKERPVKGMYHSHPTLSPRWHLAHLVTAAIPSRHQATLDICRPSIKSPQPSVLVMSVQARLAQRAAAKAAAANVAAKRPEAPGVLRGARYQRPATSLESKERSLKGIYHSHPTFSPPWHLAHLVTAIRQRVPVRLEKPRTARNALPKDVPAGRCLTPRPVDLCEFIPRLPSHPTTADPFPTVINAPMAPRAPRFRAVDDSPLALSLPAPPKVALKSILGGGARRQKREEKKKKKVAFGDVETKEVDKWIGIEQVGFVHLLPTGTFAIFPLANAIQSGH